MVRFARAEGSKGSNKRQLEEPTPWVEMVEQIESKKKKKKSKKETGATESDDCTLEQTTKKKKIVIADEQDKLQNALQHMKKQKPEVEKERSGLTQTTQDLDESKRKKKKGLRTTGPDYIITSEGKRVKVFRDGSQRTWFDLPYEESDFMTRYEGMWVKQEMVGELERLKAALEEEGLNKKEVRRPSVCLQFFYCFLSKFFANFRSNSHRLRLCFEASE